MIRVTPCRPTVALDAAVAAAAVADATSFIARRASGEMTVPRAIVAEALRWKGTPFHHQAHLRGVGCDCAGLVAGVAMAVGIVPPDWWDREFAPHAGYSRQPGGGLLHRLLEIFMRPLPIPAAGPGDVLALRYGRQPQHLAIVVPGGILHALQTGVVEHRLDDRWRRRIVSAWRYPGVA